MRADKQQLHDDETRAGDDALSTEDIANAHTEHRADDTDAPDEDMRADHDYSNDMRTEDPDMRTDDADPRTEDMTVMGTPVGGGAEANGDTETERPHTRDDDAPPTVELLASQDVERFRTQWREIQTRFVDEPRDAVRDADQLVAEVMRSLATTFTDHKHDLEGRWQEGNGIDTEELRQALRHYRSFFDHLLEV